MLKTWITIRRERIPIPTDVQVHSIQQQGSLSVQKMTIFMLKMLIIVSQEQVPYHNDV